MSDLTGPEIEYLSSVGQPVRHFRIIVIDQNHCRAKSLNDVLVYVFQKLKGNLVQYREGDVVLGVMGFFHYRGEEFPCGVAAELGIQEIETVNFLVDMVRKNLLAVFIQ